MFSTIKNICKVTFSISKITVQISGEVLKATNDFISSEEFKDGLDAVNEGLDSFNEFTKQLGSDIDIYSCKSTAKHRIKRFHIKSYAVAEEIMMSFGEIESVKIKIIKFINNHIEKINNKFNINISFIENLSLDGFCEKIDCICVDSLSENEIKELFNDLNSICLISLTNKDKAENLFNDLNLIEVTTTRLIKTKQDFGNKLIQEEFKLMVKENFELSIKEETIKKELLKNELIELLSKDKVFSEILCTSSSL